MPSTIPCWRKFTFDSNLLQKTVQASAVVAAVGQGDRPSSRCSGRLPCCWRTVAEVRGFRTGTGRMGFARSHRRCGNKTKTCRRKKRDNALPEAVWAFPEKSTVQSLIFFNGTEISNVNERYSIFRKNNAFPGNLETPHALESQTLKAFASCQSVSTRRFFSLFTSFFFLGGSNRPTTKWYCVCSLVVVHVSFIFIVQCFRKCLRVKNDSTTIEKPLEE